jgi:hypothetical protein
VTAYVISFTDLRCRFTVSVSLAAIHHCLGSVRCTFLTNRVVVLQEKSLKNTPTPTTALCHVIALQGEL